MGCWSAAVILGPTSAVPQGHLGPDGVPPEVLMPDNPWEACQYVIVGQLSMLPVCKWSLFPVTQLCDLVFCSQPDHSSGSAMLAAWGVEGLEKVLLLGFDQGRNALQDDPRTCAYTSRGRFHHKTTSH